MRRPRMAVLVAIGVLALGHGDAAARRKKTAASAGSEESIMSCVAYSQEKLAEGGLRFELRNGCQAALKCTVSWVFRCGGRDHEPQDRSSALELRPGARDWAFAYATACDADGWEITRVRWDCEPVR